MIVILKKAHTGTELSAQLISQFPLDYSARLNFASFHLRMLSTSPVTKLGNSIYGCPYGCQPSPKCAFTYGMDPNEHYFDMSTIAKSGDTPFLQD